MYYQTSIWMNFMRTCLKFLHIWYDWLWYDRPNFCSVSIPTSFDVSTFFRVHRNNFERCTIATQVWPLICFIIALKLGENIKHSLTTYRKPPNISPGLIFVRKHFLVCLYMGGLYTGVLIYGQDFVLVILTIYWLYFFITQG